MKFLERYIRFLNELEKIDQNYEGLTDTDVRERLREVINYYFVWGNLIGSDFPERFAMPTPDGDKEVRETARSFLADILNWANAEGLPLGQIRHSLLENPKALTSQANEYEVFLGCRDEVLPQKKPSPDHFFEYFDYK